MKYKNKQLKLFALIGVLLLLSGCADQVSFQAAQSITPVGFWYGLWHGIISPIAWLVSLFDEDTAIYAIYNNGGWYDFGFILGAGILFGGGSSGRS